MKKFDWTNIAVVLAIFAALGAMLVIDSRVLAIDDGRVDTYPDGFRVGGDGDKIKSLQLGTILFVNASSAAMTLEDALPGDTWTFGLSWESTSADPGKTTHVVTTNTLTINTATATTGTLSVLAVGK